MAKPEHVEILKQDKPVVPTSRKIKKFLFGGLACLMGLILWGVFLDRCLGQATGHNVACLSSP
jgi:hypothetical protein